MKREDKFNEYKRTTGELNEGMISISSILNKHKKGDLYFGLKNDGTPFKFTITESTVRDFTTFEKNTGTHAFKILQKSSCGIFCLRS